MGLSKQLRWLLVMNTVCLVVFIYTGIYVNLYIWEWERAIFDVAWFNLNMLLFWSVAFTVGVRLLNRYSIRLLTVLTAASGGAAYVLLFFLELDVRLLWITLISIPVGIMWGMFSAAQNVSLTLVGREKDFVHFFSALQIISQLLSVSVPLISAQVILIFGYPGSFVLMLALVVLIVVTAYFLPGVSLGGMATSRATASTTATTATTVEAPTESVFAHIGWKKVFNKPGAKWLILSFLCTGLFTQFQGLFVLLFTFSITQNKTIIALLSTAYALSTIFALYVYKKVRLRDEIWLYMGIAFIASGFVLLLHPVVPFLIASSVLTTVGTFYFSVLWNAQIFSLIDGYSPFQKVKVLLWREWLVIISRCTMLMLVLFVRDFSGAMFYSLLGLSVISLFLVPWFQYRALKGGNR